MKYTTDSPKQTAKIANQIANDYHDKGGLITLQGPLGAGKTSFTQAFAKALGITARITSPTFILSKQYPIPQSNRTLYHLDLYRLEKSTDLKSLDLDELLSDPTNLIVIEWPEKITNLDKLPASRITIQILSDTSREITYHPNNSKD